MTYTGMKYQGETLLDHQYTLKENEEKEGKIGLSKGWVSGGGVWA
jgi:hypothetical protein